MRYLFFSLFFLFVIGCENTGDSVDSSSVDSAYQKYLQSRKSQENSPLPVVETSSFVEEDSSLLESSEEGMDISSNEDSDGELSGESLAESEEGELSSSEEPVFSVEDEVKLGLLNTLNEDTVIETELDSPEEFDLIAEPFDEFLGDIFILTVDDEVVPSSVLPDVEENVVSARSVEEFSEEENLPSAQENPLVQEEPLEVSPSSPEPSRESPVVSSIEPSRESPVSSSPGPSRESPVSSDERELSVLEKMSLTEAQFAVLFQACHQLKRAQKCFVNTKGPWGAGRCALGWTGPIREERDKLIASGLITREEYDEKKANYNHYKKYCKEKARGSNSRRYKCFRPHVVEWMDRIVNYFNCNEI